jgi:hypothetical protein
MSSNKNKISEYTGPTALELGNIRHWDGNNWIPLANGPTGAVLTTHGVGNAPTWESLLWTPAKLNTLIWLDASDSNTIDETNGEISQWDDKSGNENHVSQGSPTFQPAIDDITMGGLPTVTFDGSDEWLETTGNPFGSTISNGFVYAAISLPIVVNGSLFSFAGTATATRWQAHVPFGDIIYFDCGGTSSPYRIQAPDGLSNGDELLIGFYCSVTDGVQVVWKNAEELVSDNVPHSVLTDGGNVDVGRFSTAYFRGGIGEFIVINNTVSLSDRQKIEGYLAHKWGLEDNLPIGHPYKSAPPSF